MKNSCPSQMPEKVINRGIEVLSADDVIEKAREAMLKQFGRELTPEAEGWLKVWNWKGGVKEIFGTEEY